MMLSPSTWRAVSQERNAVSSPLRRARPSTRTSGVRPACPLATGGAAAGPCQRAIRVVGEHVAGGDHLRVHCRCPEFGAWLIKRNAAGGFGDCHGVALRVVPCDPERKLVERLHHFDIRHPLGERKRNAQRSGGGGGCIGGALGERQVLRLWSADELVSAKFLKKAVRELKIIAL